MPNRRNVKSDNFEATDLHEREKDFLNDAELEKLFEAAKKSRYGLRNHLLFFMMYHGLRVSEALGIRVADIDLKSSRLCVRRSKNGLSVEQPIGGDELRLLKRHLSTRKSSLPWLFLSERQQAMTRQNVNYILQSAADRAGLGLINPHMLRHSCGFYLANKGYDLRLIQDYLGHRDPKHTVRYTRVSSHRFEGLW
jgi:type 1 fimbriae regulatory protein FimB/type 1 fimbriae regulatory protein FimE